jgi:hypothetical protein
VDALGIFLYNEQYGRILPNINQKVYDFKELSKRIEEWQDKL